jgi:hypothetical protein
MRVDLDEEFAALQAALRELWEALMNDDRLLDVDLGDAFPHLARAITLSANLAKACGYEESRRH